MYISDVVGIYKNGNYDCCINIFLENSSNNKPAFGSNLYLKLENIEETYKEYIYQSNSAVCQAMMKPCNAENWQDSLNQFIKLHSRYRSLMSIPFDLEMSVVYNTISWFCMNNKFKQYKTLYFQTINHTISKTLIKVLKSCGELIVDQDLSQETTRLINIIKQASDRLLRLCPVTCKQLLDIITVTELMLMRLGTHETIAEFSSLFKRIIDQFDILKLHLKQDVNSGLEEIYFKFGFTCPNATASLKYCTDSLNAFILAGSIVCALNKEFDHSMESLKQIEEIEDNSFQFLVNYLKAYCCLQTQHYSEAKLCLAYSASTVRYEGYYRLLLARLLSAQGDNHAALEQCEAAIAFPRQAADAANLAATTAANINLTTAQLTYLTQLVQNLKLNSLSLEDGQMDGFEECCLSVLSQQYLVTLPQAMYSLSKQLYLAGYHVKARDSYTELVALIRAGGNEPMAEATLPRYTQLLHETVLTHLKTNNFTEGEQLCRQLIRNHMPSSCKPDGESHWETGLYSLDDDIVSMLLLADIIAHNKKKAIEELNRCYSALSEAREQQEALNELCDWLLSRTLLRKARLSVTDEAVHYFRRALIHKPGDKEVLYHYKQWSLWNPDHQSFDPGDKVAVFPESEVGSLALRHLLGCSVSEEEWTALFDHETSQNVLESLFDDDD